MTIFEKFFAMFTPKDKPLAGKVQLVGSLIARLMAVEEFYFWKAVTSRERDRSICYHSASMVHRRLAGEVSQCFSVCRHYEQYAEAMSAELLKERRKRKKYGGSLDDEAVQTFSAKLFEELQNTYESLLRYERLQKFQHELLNLQLRECRLILQKVHFVCSLPSVEHVKEQLVHS